MPRTLFDKFLWCLLGTVCIALVLLSVRGSGVRSETGGKAFDRALEQSLKYQARIALIRELYAPVEVLRQSGQVESALLKLAEIERDYPAEAHGRILKGEIQARLGAVDEAVASYAAGVRLSGDYVDRDSPLSQRETIQKLVADGLVNVTTRLAAHPDNRTALETRKELYYLQSRLAGGCE